MSVCEEFNWFIFDYFSNMKFETYGMKMYVHTYLIIDCKTMYVAHSMSSKHTHSTVTLFHWCLANMCMIK